MSTGTQHVLTREEADQVRQLEDLIGVKVLGELGRGTQTVVYRARRDGADYALKMLCGADADGASLAAFRREAALLARVRHPKLARVHEVGVVQDRPYLVMDLIEGRRLTDLLAAGPLSAEQTATIGADVAGALSTGHRAGVIHRDVKPDNIMVTPDGHAHLLDFGLAVRAADERVGDQRSGDGRDDAVAGTLIYSAPEQSGVLNRPTDDRADLYALGAVLFECATGHPPFRSADVGELLRMHANTPAADVRAERPDLPPALAGIVATLLAKDPDDRYHSAAGLAADLGRLTTERDFAPRSADEPVGQRADTPLIGRDTELSTLADRWARARLGHGGVAVVEGPPGSGKSRLVRELLASARASGHVVLHGAGRADEPTPLAPLRRAVDDYVRSLSRLPQVERDRARGWLADAAGPAAALLRTLSPALGELLGRPDLTDEDRHEQFMVAVADFLIGLACHAAGAILYVEDAQWIDEPSRRILTNLVEGLSTTPLLVVLDLRTEADGGDAPATLASGFGESLDTRIALPTFGAADVAGLVAALTGGMTITTQTAAHLAARSGANPSAFLEYFDAIIDAGLLRPHWGTWQLDVEGLDRLALPGTIEELVLRRLEPLDGPARQVLRAAAAVGCRFDPEFIAAVCRLDRQQVLDIVTDAARHHLVERRDDNEYAFVHHRIQEALLSQADGAAPAELHERIADLLEKRADGTAESVYALARHCQLAGVNHQPQRLFRAAYAAGRLALADHAPDQAVAFLESACTAAGVPAPHVSAYHTTLGVAYHRTGRFRDATQAFERALAATPGGVERASIRHLIARVHDSTWSTSEQLAVLEQGLSDLGQALPSNRVRLLVSAVSHCVLGYLVAVTRLGYGTVRGARRERYRLLASLYDAATVAYARDLRPATSAVFVLRQAYLVNRLGPGPEMVRAKVAMAYLACRAGLHLLADRGFAQSVRIATRLGDAQLLAYIAWLRGAAAYGSGADNGAALRRALSDHGRWLDPGQYIDALGLLCWDSMLAGNTTEADAWFERRRERVTASGQLNRNATHTATVGQLAMRGRAGEAAALLKRIRERTPVQPLWERVDSIMGTLIGAVEQNDHGAVDQAAEEFRSLRLGPLSLLPGQEGLYTYMAYGRLEQVRAARPTDRAERLAAARRAVRALRFVPRRPLLRAHRQVALAALAQVAGRPERALRLLARGEPVMRRVEAPLVAFEAARVRVHALRALGCRGEADRQARYTLAIAAEQGWSHRARRITAEFDVKSATGSYSNLTSHGPGTDSVPSGRHKQRLDALEQVSLAASRVLDPAKLARIALDETIRIFAAERAFLFLLEGEPPQLVPHIGRDSAGGDLHDPTGYSATLVDRVRQTREALVVTGTEEGAALGSQSMVLHGLRSIMVAPLQLEGRLLGVVYLDSRLAKGVFTADDIGILAAITNHVAVALETARAAQMEVAMTTAYRERDLAETLRSAATDLSAALRPTEVLGKLAEITARTLHNGQVLVVVGQPVVGQRTGPVISVPPGDGRVEALIASPGPVVGSGVDAPELMRAEFDTVASWMAVPLRAGDDRTGVLLLASREPAAYSEAQVEIAATLAGQGMIAYEKAVLFTHVERLATLDELTGVANRRTFFEAATGELARPAERRPALAALMIDIDHFKAVNDTHGHQAGDEVIQAVAGRLRDLGRAGDLLGRYGGEEFAVLMRVGADATDSGRDGGGAVGGDGTGSTGGKAAAIDDARAAAERLRRAVADAPIQTRGGPLTVTISVGLTLVQPDDRDLGAVLARADDCLYRAKQAGRNRVFSS